MIRRSRWLAALIVVGLIAGMTGGTSPRSAPPTSNGANSFGVKADYEAPTVVRSEIARTTATAGGRIKANVAYYVYAQITDGGNPASGVSTRHRQRVQHHDRDLRIGGARRPARTR